MTTVFDARLHLIPAEAQVAAYVSQGYARPGDFVCGTDTGALYCVSDEGVFQPKADAVLPPAATHDSAGVVQLATNAEVAGGTDDTTAITPLGLATSLPGLLPVADNTNNGIVHILASGGLGVDSQGGLAINPPILQGILPIAKADATGIVSIPAGSNLSVTAQGALSVPLASPTVAGVASFPAAGHLAVTAQGAVSVPVASASAVGVVSVAAGSGLAVTGAGALSVAAATSTQAGGVKAIPSATFPARTDNSGGTSGGNVIAAVTDIASAANAIATLQAEIAELRAALVTAGHIV